MSELEALKLLWPIFVILAIPGIPLLCLYLVSKPDNNNNIDSENGKKANKNEEELWEFLFKGPDKKSRIEEDSEEVWERLGDSVYRDFILGLDDEGFGKNN